MTQTFADLAASLAATLGFAIFLLPPGYLLGIATDFFGMRTRSAEEQCLWSVVLSIPCALLLAELGRVLSPDTVLAIFCGLALAAVALLVVRRMRAQPHPAASASDRLATRFVCAVLVFWLVYSLLALLDVQWGHHVYIATVSTDWAVRLPMVRASVHGPIPPDNPLSALGTAPSPLRYYYFWYVLCAQVVRLFHLSDKAALTASCVWAGSALLGVTFLTLKYLVHQRDRLRRLTVLLPLLVIGLDIIVVVIDILRHQNMRLDMEWWRSDRTPAIVTTIWYAPHHIAGLVCCFVGLLALADTTGRLSGRMSARASLPRDIAIAAIVSGMAFGACVGTSTFLALIFIVILLLWGIEQLIERGWADLIALAGCALVTRTFAHPFLLGLATGKSAAHGMASFSWRSSPFVRNLFTAKHVLIHHPLLAFAARQPAILLMDFFELGFFAFVLADRARRDLLPALRRERRLEFSDRLLWTVLAGAGLMALFVSSAVTASANDLGMHAGLVVRFVLVLWSAPYLQRVWQQLRDRTPQTPGRRLFTGAALACLALGLIGGLYGIFMNRAYFPLVEAHVIHSPAEELTGNDLSERLYDIRSAWRQMDRSLPPTARVEFDPMGLMQPAWSYFSHRQIVASDAGCGTPFGGDPSLCPLIDAEMHRLFATAPELSQIGGFSRYAPSNRIASVKDFDTACRDLAADVIGVDSTDPVWEQPSSWVWKLQPVLSRPTLKVFACPPRIH